MAQSKKTRQGKRTPAYSADSMVFALIAGLLLIALGVLIFLSTATSMVGDIFLILRQVSRGMAGPVSILLPVIPVWGGVLVVLSTQRKAPVRPYVLACVLFLLACTTVMLLTFVQGSKSLIAYIQDVNASRGVGTGLSPALTLAYQYGISNAGGGLLGMLLAWPLSQFLGNVGGAIVTIVALIVVFLFLIRLDVKGIAAKAKQRRADRSAQRAQEEQQMRQQELMWQQEQMRRQQEQMRLQQEQMRQQQMQQEQMRQQQMQQEQMRQQQMQQMPPQQAWSNMVPEGAANWNQMQGYGQQHPQRSGPIVRQVQTARQRSQPQPQVGFQPTPEENGQYMPPVEELPLNGETGSKKKRGGLFRRDQQTDPVAMSRRLNVFDQPLEDELPAAQAPVTPQKRRSKPAEPPVQEVPPQEEELHLPRQLEAAIPDEPDEPAVPAVAAPMPEPEPEPEREARPGSFMARLKAARAAAGMTAEPEAENPPARKARKDTPSAWSTQEPAAASWRSNEEWQSEAGVSVRPSARRAGTKPAARPDAAASSAPARQKPKASWADTPPWEDSPEYTDIDQPSEVVTPVVTQKAPEGSWQADLKLPTRRTSAAEQMSAPLFDEPAEVPYVYPPLDLLKTPEPQQGISEEEDAMRSRRLENTLQSFRVPAKVRHITHGPAISRFELELAAGIKVSKVTDLNRNIAMNMEVKSVRIEAPIPGKSLVGVEVPNKQRATVTLKEVLTSDVMAKNTKPLVVALGKDIAGTPIVCDLAKMPHLLIAGATGSGKSVCINTIINSLLYRCSPKDVRLILVDPKVVELQCYNGIPHLLIPVVSDPHKASGALAWAVGEMMDRYKIFQEAGVRQIDGYNESLPPEADKMPRIVIVIDELADLMMTCKKDVEERICRLAQLARACGIHLIVATQRPSVDVITGLIKANIPSRIAFKVSSNVDSRTILDRIGAEQLLGYGDMLYMPTGEFTPIRVQGCFLSDPEVNRITDFIRENCPSDYDPKVLEELEKLQAESDATPMPDMGGSDDFAPSDGSLLTQCIEMAVNDGQVSTSLIQRRLKLGYARAGRLVDEMEKRGIVSQKDGAKPRMCLISRDEFEQMKNSGLLD